MRTEKNLHTKKIDDQIKRQIDRNVIYYADHPEEIDGRLKELNKEWNIERKIQVNGAVVNLVTIVMGLLLSRKWLIATSLIDCLLYRHAKTGWCPAVPLLRRFGTRKQSEIEHEYYVLKALRGDFEPLGITSKITQQQFCAF
jgi:hypothetical protein